MPIFPTALPDEFLVNTTTADNQYESRVAALADGRFVVVWTDRSETEPDLYEAAVRSRIYNADGTAASAEMVVNTTLLGDQYSPQISALPDGGFAVVWADDSSWVGDASSSAVRLQRFSAAGAKVGGEILVNTITTGAQDVPHVTTLTDGRLVVVWSDASETAPDTQATAIRAQIFAASGAKSGPEFLVNSSHAITQIDPHVLALPGGRFLITFTDFSGETPGSDSAEIMGVLYAANGTVEKAQFAINAGFANYQAKSKAVALEGGRILVTWETANSDLSDIDIAGRILNADGSFFTADFAMNTATAGWQEGVSVAALRGGGFIATWTDESMTGADTSYRAVRAQIFAANGQKTGAEIVVNQLTPQDQIAPSVTVLADGRVAVSWTDIGEQTADTDQGAIMATILDLRDGAVRLTGTALQDQWIGTKFGDVMDGKAGSDKMTGGLGDDVYVVDRSTDLVIEAANGGRDQVRSAVMSLKLAAYANVENAALTGTATLSLTGTEGANRLVGNAGANRMDGKAGSDRMAGGAGDDSYVIDRLGDVITETARGGIDRVESAVISVDLARFAQTENALLTGNRALDVSGNAVANRLTGNSAGNDMHGMAGNDTLLGGGGVDQLYGGKGRDSLSGGLGGDAFIFASAAEAGKGAGRDVIADFKHLVDDIDLSTFMAGGQFIEAAAFSRHANEVRYTRATGLLQGDVNGDAVVDWEITLANKAVLSDADFIF